MKDKKTISQAWELIEKSNRITLSTHSSPDGDGVSSCLALELILTKLGKSVETVYPDAPEFELERQPKKVSTGRHEQEPELLIVCDTANYERFYYPENFRSLPLVNIDHHASNSIDGTCNFVESEISSTSEVLYSLIVEWEAISKLSMIDKPVAEALLTGILYDTQVFRISSTTQDTLRIAAALIDKGANLFQLKDELLAHKDPQIVKMWEFLLGRVEISYEKQVAWTYITQADLKKLNLKLSNLVGFKNFLGEIGKVDITILFYESDEGKTKVSLRSRVRDVNELAAKFGGGGHKQASGITSDVPLDRLIKNVLEAITPPTGGFTPL